MSTIKAIIRENKINSKGECTIFVRYRYKQGSIDISTGLMIKPQFWNKKKQVINSASGIANSKKNEQLIKDHKKNDLLANSQVELLKAEITTITRELKLEGIEPECAIVKAKLTKANSDESTQTNSTTKLVPLFREYIEKSRKSDSTKRAYRTTLRHLTEYQKGRKLTIQTSDLTLKRYDDIINFLINEIEQPDGTIGLSDNTIGTFTKRLKVVIKFLQERDYKIPINPADLKVVMTAAPIYFLTEEEIQILDDFKFEEERLTKVKDIFIFNCYTGLRISDLSRLRAHHIVDGVIKLRTYKSQKDTFNPLISRSKEILEKYDYKLPMISEQKYNQYIKEACMKVGINHPVEIIKKSSGNKS